MTDDPHVLLGRRIVFLRKHRKRWSQERLAMEAKVGRSYLATIELGRKNVSFRILLKLAAALQVTVAELVAYDDTSANEDRYRD